MKIKYALKLYLSNVSVVFSDLLFRVVSTIVILCLAATFVTPLVTEIMNSEQISALFDAVKAVVISFFGLGASMAESSEALALARVGVLGLLTQYLSQITWVVIGLIVAFVLLKFFNGMANYASGVVVNDYMSSLTKTKYLTAILNNFKQGFLYQLLNAVAKIIWIVVLLILCSLLMRATVGWMGVFALTLNVFLFNCGMGAYYALFSNFLPSVIVDNNGIFTSFKKCFSIPFKQFGELFATYTILNLLLIWFNFSMGVCTMGAGLIFTLPASAVSFSYIKLINYYTVTKRKFYIDKKNIVFSGDKITGEDKFLADIDK